MIRDESRELIRIIRALAFRTLPSWEHSRTNLYLDRKTYKEGEFIGPRRQEIVASRPTILVFADQEPQANFSHRCRYLLHDARNGELYSNRLAQFPPVVATEPASLEPFHQPIRF